MEKEPLRVLFLCTGNSARSQMGEALLRQRRAFERTAKDLMGGTRIWLSLPKVSARTGAAAVGHAL